MGRRRRSSLKLKKLHILQVMQILYKVEHTRLKTMGLTLNYAQSLSGLIKYYNSNLTVKVDNDLNKFGQTVISLGQIK
jgi:hypothetical protein